MQNERLSLLCIEDATLINGLKIQFLQCRQKVKKNLVRRWLKCKRITQGLTSQEMDVIRVTKRRGNRNSTIWRNFSSWSKFILYNLVESNLFWWTTWSSGWQLRFYRIVPNYKISIFPHVCRPFTIKMRPKGLKPILTESFQCSVQRSDMSGGGVQNVIFSGGYSSPVDCTQIVIFLWAKGAQVLVLWKYAGWFALDDALWVQLRKDLFLGHGWMGQSQTVLLTQTTN